MANETAKHTPGPWMVGPSDDTLVTHLGKGRLRYEVAAIKGDYSDPETWPVMEANARLIAAAPDLLEVATRYVAVADAAGVSDALSNDFRAAIAKAFGQPAPRPAFTTSELSALADQGMTLTDEEAHRIAMARNTDNSGEAPC